MAGLYKKKPIIEGKISINSLLLAIMNKHTGSKSWIFETPVEDLPKFPMLFASIRKYKTPKTDPIKKLSPEDKPILIVAIRDRTIEITKVITKITT